jgi:acetyl-CoA carboxylase carboxyl transferase alpha subunit
MTDPPTPAAGESAAWQVLTRARHAQRPTASWYLAESFSGFCELHGDRRYRDDPAIRGGFAWLGRRPVVVVAQESGRVRGAGERHNYGMAFPEGYYKAERLMRLAERFDRPVVTLVDTPGAYPGLGAEDRGQARAIAEMLRCMAGLEVPTVAVVIGQGGSGGALALAFADRVLMLENAVYSVISPEGCASILWRRADRAPNAAEALGMTAPALAAHGVVDEVVPEPAAGIAVRPREAAIRLRRAVERALRRLDAVEPGERLRQRAARYDELGVYRD